MEQAENALVKLCQAQTAVLEATVPAIEGAISEITRLREGLSKIEASCKVAFEELDESYKVVDAFDRIQKIAQQREAEFLVKGGKLE